MKVLLKIYFENQQEYLDYMLMKGEVHADPVLVQPKVEEVHAEPEKAPVESGLTTCAYPGCTGTFIQKRSDQKFCSPECWKKDYKGKYGSNKQPSEETAENHVCKYWNCKKSFIPTEDEPNALYCSSICESRDAKVQRQNKVLKEIKDNYPVKRGRPRLEKDAQ